MDIPQHIQSSLAIGSPVTPEQLEAAADAWPSLRIVLGLSGDEFKEAIINGFAAGFTYKLSPQSRPPQIWKYIEISSGVSIEGIAVLTPQSISSVPPTAVGQALVRAWFSDQGIITNAAIPASMSILGLPASSSIGTFASDFVRIWAETIPFLEGAVASPSWISKSQIGIAANCRFTSNQPGNVKYKALFLEAVSEIKLKWRTLALYRILEHGYLTEIYQTIEARFFESPEETLKSAVKLVGSEVSQFIALVDSAALRDDAKLIYDEYEKMRMAGNRFAIALDRSMSQSGQVQQASAPWQKGVLVFYKIRCAIVHAGLSAPIFDSYSDGDALLENLLPLCESLVLNFLGMTII